MIKNIFKVLLISLLILFSHNISSAQTNSDAYNSRNLRMIEPSGSATYNIGDVVVIKWVVDNSSNIDGRIGIEISNQESGKNLIVEYACRSRDLISSNLCSNISTYPSLDGKVRLYNWNIPEYLPTGNYKVYIRYYDGNG